MPPLTDEIRYRLLKCLAEHPGLSQRQLAQELGISVGKANYCVRALIDKGLLKVRNFQRSDRKSAYLYVLTRKGLEAKVKATRAFLARKMAEYGTIEQEIRRLTAEIESLNEKSEVAS